MSNLIQTTTELAIHIMSGYISPGALLIDATCGNGHDTLRLARMQPSKLYAFDIQQAAVDSTRKLLESNGFKDSIDEGIIELICASHENMESYVREKADVIVFNLGYLPGSDKSNTTTEYSTLKAVSASLELLKENGLVCIAIYSGHEEGSKEKTALLNWSSDLDPSVYHAVYISMRNQKNHPPEILLVTRKR